MRPNRNAFLIMLTLVAMAGCGVPGPGPSPIPTPMQRTVIIDYSTLPDGVVPYGAVRGTPAYGSTVDDTPKVRDAGDLRKLRDAPDDFKAFLAKYIEETEAEVNAVLAAELRSVQSEQCEFIVELRVWGVAPHVATGRERRCGKDSFDVIWAKQAGGWRLVETMQGGWDCAVLERYRVPADITGAVCWYDVYKNRAYNGPRR